MTAAERLVAAARAYDGKPFRHMGRSATGLDCVGLLLLAAHDAGIEAEDPGRYAFGHRGWDMLSWLAERFVRVLPITGHADGDILLFRDASGRQPCHVGLRTTKHSVPHVLHAHLGRRRVMEEPLSHDLADELRAAFRVEG